MTHRWNHFCMPFQIGQERISVSATDRENAHNNRQWKTIERCTFSDEQRRANLINGQQILVISTIRLSRTDERILHGICSGSSLRLIKQISEVKQMDENSARVKSVRPDVRCSDRKQA